MYCLIVLRTIRGGDESAFVPNLAVFFGLVLALGGVGAHTRTQAHVWSIEGAVESGRRAAKAIDRRVAVLDQVRPLWISALPKIDDILHTVRAPQVFDAAFYLFLGVCVYLVDVGFTL